MSREGLQAYLRSSSALFTFHEIHPEDVEQRTGLTQRPASEKKGDIVERLWWNLKDEVARVNGGDEGEGVEIEFPLAMLLFKKV